MFQAFCNVSKRFVYIIRSPKMNLPAIILISIVCGFFVFGDSPIKGAPLQPTHAATNNCNIAPIDGEAMAIGLHDGSVNVKEHFVGKGVVFQPPLPTQCQTVRDKCHNQQTADSPEDFSLCDHVAILRRKLEQLEEKLQCVIFCLIGGVIGAIGVCIFER